MNTENATNSIHSVEPSDECFSFCFASNSRAIRFTLMQPQFIIIFHAHAHAHTLPQSASNFHHFLFYPHNAKRQAKKEIAKQKKGAQKQNWWGDFLKIIDKIVFVREKILI